MISIDTPIVSMQAKGNQKDRAIRVPYTHFASYDAAKNETTIFVAVRLVKSENKIKQVIRSTQSHYKQNGITGYNLKYFSQGADVIKAFSLN